MLRLMYYAVSGRSSSAPAAATLSWPPRRAASALLVLLALWLLPAGAAPAFPSGLFEHPLPAKLPQPLQDIRRRFQQAHVLELDFKQKKRLPELKQPLISTGKLTVVPSLGLEWRIIQPFASVWRVAKDGYVLKGPDNPASEAIAHLLIALLSANTDALKSSFSLYWQQPSQQWWLGLKPRDPRLQKALRSIVVSGDKTLRQVSVSEHNGDRTELDFTAMQTRPLTDALREKFSH